MDPLHLCVDGKEVGKKFSVEKLHAKEFVDMLSPFESAPLQRSPLQRFETVFRLPLRTQRNIRHDGTHGSFGPAFSSDDIRTKLRIFASRAEELLLFSKNVRHVEFAAMSVSKKVDTIAILERGSHSAGPPSVMQTLPTTIEAVRECADTPRHQVEAVSITITRDGKHDAQEQQDWLIAHAIEADVNLLGQVEQQLREGTAMLPHGAAAVRLGDAGGYRGRVCCYMPLASMELGIPLVLHGCFAVPADRKSVPCTESGDDGGKQLWNRALLQGPVASSLALLVEHACAHADGVALQLSTWFSLMSLPDDRLNPKNRRYVNSSTHELRTVVRTATLAKLLPKCVFPVVIPEADDAKLRDVREWQKGLSAVLRVSDDAVLPASTQNELIKAGLPLVYLPPELQTQFQQVISLRFDDPTRYLQPLSPNQLCDFLRGDVPLRVGDGIGASVIKLAKFIVSRHKPGDDECNGIMRLRGLPLLLRSDNTLSRFGETQCFFDHAELLPHKPELFVHKDLRSVITTAYSDLVRQSKKIERLDFFVDAIGIPAFRSSDLLHHRESVHSEAKCISDSAWRQHAFSLIVPNSGPTIDRAEVDKALRRVLTDFADWKLVKVVDPSGKEKLVPLRELSNVFSLRDVELFKDKLGDILQGCGAYVL